jgi:outer membrane lipase/esterase
MRLMSHIAVAAALMLVGQPAAAASSSYSSLYVFGDSLVDAGNARNARLQAGLADPAPPSQGYFNGRFSNGPNFADYVSQALLEKLTIPALNGGMNYAVGGANAASPFPPTLPDPKNPRPLSFLEQIGYFGAQKIASDALVLVTFGGNDVRDTFGTSGTQSFDRARADLRTGLTALVGAGARNIIVTGLPDVGKLPETLLVRKADSQQAQLLTERSEYLNRQFGAIAMDVRAATGADVDFFNLLRFQRSVLAAPADYGLPSNLNSTTPCQFAGAAAVASGCNGYLYFDPIHPTTQVHEAIAQGILTLAAVPEPSTWVMLIAGFGGIGVALRRARRRSGSPPFSPALA